LELKKQKQKHFKHSTFSFIHCWLLLKDILRSADMQEELKHAPPPKHHSFEKKEETPTNVIKIDDMRIEEKFCIIFSHI